MPNHQGWRPRGLTDGLRPWARDIAVQRGLFLTGAEWSIGLSSFNSLHDISNLVYAPPILAAADISDVSARLVADPFLFQFQERLYLFMEILDASSEKGVIGWAELESDNIWRFGGVALRRPFHLSYPHIFSFEQDIYLIPETSSERSVYLYKASQFPSDWQYCATLLDGAPFADASVFRHGGLWWMFVETSSGPRFDTLRLYMSTHLQGPWSEHPDSPIVVGDAGASRPAGPPVWLDGKLIRFAQDCREVYGKAVFGFEVIRLDGSSYKERPLGRTPLLFGRGSDWNGQAMHHISMLRSGEHWLAAVDGRPLSGFRFPTVARQGRRRRRSRKPGG